MTELDILQKISQASGKNEKRSLLENSKDNKRLGELLDASLNFFRKFHIHKFDITSQASIEADLHDEFMQLLIKLENRELTGHAAKGAVEEFFNKCSDNQQHWYARVLRKDLKIGVSDETAAKFFDIPTFDVMLATDGKKCKRLDSIINAGVYASPKFDGYRCLAVIINGEVTLYSRNGSVFTNFPSIAASLEKTFAGKSCVLDGEIMSDDFQSMQKSAFASKRGTTVGDVKYHVFDCLTLTEWKTGQFKMKKSERMNLMAGLKIFFEKDIIIAVDQKFVTSLEEIKQLEASYIEMGFEGVMVLPDIPYYKGREANSLMKFKTMVSQDCEIVGFYEGKPGTKHEGRLGGLVLKQENGLECDCGSGFSDADRDYIWQNQSEFLGRIIETKYQELTPDSIMRFPIFMRFRDLTSGFGKL
jgi:DNA ligase-1